MPPTEPGSVEAGRDRARESDSTRFPVVTSSRSRDGWFFEIEVPAESPYFEGHFSGAPVLPGVAQLALLLQLYRLATGTLVEFRDVSMLRFRGKILPGDLLQATISEPDTTGHSRFLLRRQAEIVTRCTFSTYGEIR